MFDRFWLISPDSKWLISLGPNSDNEVMRSVIDRFGENVQTETVDEQHFRATVEVAPSPPFFSWVFTFSGKIRIVSPAAVLEEMRDMAAWLK